MIHHLSIAARDPKVLPYIDGKELARTVVVPGKLVNFVVK